MIQSIDPLRARRGATGDRAGGREGAPADELAALRARNRIAGPLDVELPDRLVRKLAADHLRELRDDGLTVDYVARMYGVSAERMEILYNELLPTPPR